MTLASPASVSTVVRCGSQRTNRVSPWVRRNPSPVTASRSAVSITEIAAPVPGPTPTPVPALVPARDPPHDPVAGVALRTSAAPVPEPIPVSGPAPVPGPAPVLGPAPIPGLNGLHLAQRRQQGADVSNRAIPGIQAHREDPLGHERPHSNQQTGHRAGHILRLVGRSRLACLVPAVHLARMACLVRMACAVRAGCLVRAACRSGCARLGPIAAFAQVQHPRARRRPRRCSTLSVHLATPPIYPNTCSNPITGGHSPKQPWRACG